MYPDLHKAAAQAHVEDLKRSADAHRIAADAGTARRGLSGLRRLELRRVTPLWVRSAIARRRVARTGSARAGVSLADRDRGSVKDRRGGADVSSVAGAGA
jgi:hypothetical protein